MHRNGNQRTKLKWHSSFSHPISLACRPCSHVQAYGLEHCAHLGQLFLFCEFSAFPQKTGITDSSEEGEQQKLNNVRVANLELMSCLLRENSHCASSLNWRSNLSIREKENTLNTNWKRWIYRLRNVRGEELASMAPGRRDLRCEEILDSTMRWYVCLSFCVPDVIEDLDLPLRTTNSESVFHQKGKTYSFMQQKQDVRKCFPI